MPIPNSNRSPSPISSTPHSRNSDPNSTTRKIFSRTPSNKPSVLTNPRNFNSTTPANSPSGFGRRLSAGNEGADEKENEVKEQSIKPVKPRSSATGSKNFMSPTISAAYKLTPSPRKKVLEERNDPVRSSISLPEGIFSSTAEVVVPISDQKSVETQMESIANDSQQKKVIPERPFGSKSVKRVTFADYTLDSVNSTEFKADSLVLQSDYVVTDLSAKNETSGDSASRIIAPLDADPSFLPYDPMTNYLSPRPRFLYYRPNPRVAVLNDRENKMDGVRRLEDTFASFENNSSDTSDSTEEILDSEDSSSVEIERPKVEEEEEEEEEKEEEEEEEEEIHGSESLICKRKNVYENSLKVEEGKKKEKKVLPRRLALICCMLVVLVVSCYSFSVTYSPGTDSTILKALNSSQLNQRAAIVDLAKANFNLFSKRFKQFSVKSISRMVNIRQGGQLNSLQFMNLTELQNDILLGEGGGYLNQESEKSPEWDNLQVENSDWDDSEEEETEEIVESFEENFGEYVSDSTDHDPVIENDLLLIEALSPDSEEIIRNQVEDASNHDTESHHYVNHEHFADTALDSHKQNNHECAASLDSDANVEPLQDYELSKEYVIAIAPVLESGIDINLEFLESNVILKSDTNVEGLSEDINVDGTPSSDAYNPPNVELPFDMEPSTLGVNSRTKTSAYHHMSRVALVLAIVSISFAAYYINRQRCNGSKRKLGVDTHESLTKKPILTTSVIMEEQMNHDKLSIIDDVGECFSSEMSSYQSYNKNNRSRSSNDEAHSGKSRPRKFSKRESFSSSDFSLDGGGSHSYGSFTTYERIPIKKATGDNEITTPVRRSSRLRSNVTS